jgi:hypothetical protein
MSVHGRSETLAPPWGDDAQRPGGTPTARGRPDALNRELVARRAVL